MNRSVGELRYHCIIMAWVAMRQRAPQVYHTFELLSFNIFEFYYLDKKGKITSRLLLLVMVKLRLIHQYIYIFDG